MDYIEESKGLSRLGQSKDDDEDSIKESIRPEEEDSIAIEIPEGSALGSDDDEIKESIHIEGKKLQDSRAKNADKDLHKMRMALGSEEALRQESKKALKKS